MYVYNPANFNVNKANFLAPISGPASYKLAYAADGVVKHPGAWGRVVMSYDGDGFSYGVRVDRADDADTVDGYHAASLMGGYSGGQALLPNGGYQKLANGFTIQWGAFNANNSNTAGTPQVINLPVAFANAVVYAGLSEDGGYSSGGEIAVMDWSTPGKTTLSTIGVYTNYYGVVKFMAIGY